MPRAEARGGELLRVGLKISEGLWLQLVDRSGFLGLAGPLLAKVGSDLLRELVAVLVVLLVVAHEPLEQVVFDGEGADFVEVSPEVQLLPSPGVEGRNVSCLLHIYFI